MKKQNLTKIQYSVKVQNAFVYKTVSSLVFNLNFCILLTSTDNTLLVTVDVTVVAGNCNKLWWLLITVGDM